MKKIAVFAVLCFLVISVTGCPLIEKITGRSGSGGSSGDASGVYVYEIWEGEPTFNITYHIVTLNTDGTCHEKYEWVSLSGTQKTLQEGALGTWTLDGKTVTLNWDSGGSISYELDKDRLKWSIETGYQTGEYSTVLFKKE